MQNKYNNCIYFYDKFTKKKLLSVHKSRIFSQKYFLKQSEILNVLIFWTEMSIVINLSLRTFTQIVLWKRRNLKFKIHVYKTTSFHYLLLQILYVRHSLSKVCPVSTRCSWLITMYVLNKNPIFSLFIFRKVKYAFWVCFQNVRKQKCAITKHIFWLKIFLYIL